MSKKNSLKKRIGLLALAGVFAATPAVSAVPVLANEASVTWEVVEQGILDNNQYAYKKKDGTYKTDSTMSSALLKKFNDSSSSGYVINGKVATGTGTILGQSFNGWWRIVNGWLDKSTGLLNTNDGWYSFNGGQLVYTENETLGKNSNGTFYLKNGKYDNSYTGLVAYDDGIAYVKSGKVYTDFTGAVTDTTGAAHKGDIFYIEKGYFKNISTTVAKHTDGTWYKITNGKADLTYNGVAKNDNGWWYIRNGKVDFSYTGAAANENGVWYIAGGQVNFNYTGSYGGFYFQGGKAVQ